MLRPFARGLAIVGQQLPTLLDATYCVRLHTDTLLHVVGICCIRLHTTVTRPQQNATLLTQQCWELLRPFAHYCNTAATKRNIVDATMLGVVASACT